MGARWADLRAAAVAAEEGGFDGLWTWDHLRDPDGDPAGVPECMTTLAALAEVTRRMTIGPLVLNVANRHPGLLANMAATAGTHGDGFNTQAHTPRLASLAQIALDSHKAAGRDPARFGVSVFAGFAPAWLRADSENRAALSRAGVGRLILLVEPPYDPSQIRAAARLLSG